MMKLKRGNLGDLLNSAWLRAGVLLLLYGSTALASCWLAFQLRFDFAPSAEFQRRFNEDWVWVVGLQLLFLCACGQFSGLLSYFSIPDLRKLFYATAGNSALLLVLRYNTSVLSDFPRGVLLSNFVLVFSGLAALRLSFRMVRERFLMPQNRRNGTARRVGILGAGDVGASLARELGSKRGLGLSPVAFFDDDKAKWHSRIHEIPVMGPPEALLDQRLNLELDEIIIAMPSATSKRMQEVIQVLRRTRLKFVTVPSVDQLATGVVKVSQLRDVEIQDLLGRSPVELQTESIQQTLAGKVVMVTGAGGSIGSELSRQIASFNPQRLLLLDQSEVQLFQIEQELIEAGYRGAILPLVADILETQRMRYIFTRFKPAVVFHAAAHKHVPMMESQPSEALRNNSMGTAQLAELALETGVDRFVLISTDKAINPTNVMGASKRLAEIFLQALYSSQPTKTKFMAVRFGNVLGSSGSVIPIFNKQIAAGGPVKVTHPEVMRYFMTIPEAAGLVLQSAAQGLGGEIFVLDMGKPVKIVELARQLIELNGLKPDEDIAIEFVGLRPGEKLFEELSYRGENITPTTHPKIMRFVCQAQPLDEVEKWMEKLGHVLYESEPNQIKLLLKQAVPEYQPYLM